MSLLGNLVSQVATQALSQNRSTSNNSQNSAQSGGLGDILGSVLGGSSNNTNTQSGGMGDILGSVLNSQMGGNANSGAGGLGSILGSVLNSGATKGNTGSGGKGMLLAVLMPIVLQWIQKNGGVSGALEKVQNMGFGQQVQSWMSTDQANENLDPNQVDKLFDTQDIQQVCQTTGADETEVRQGLATLLPEVINQVTPTGGLEKEQEANSEIAEILQQISGTMFK